MARHIAQWIKNQGLAVLRGIWQWVRNVACVFNQGVCALIGKDPFMTISAVAYLHNIRWLVWLANTIYRDPDHCKVAATGWDTPEWQARDRSLWKHF